VLSSFTEYSNTVTRWK